MDGSYKWIIWMEMTDGETNSPKIDCNSKQRDIEFISGGSNDNGDKNLVKR